MVMSEAPLARAGKRIRSPRAAAAAGMLFALLYATSQVLIRSAVPRELGESGAWLEQQARTLTLALALVPFAGIFFLWFIGVVRDQLGQREDQFFATVFLGSGLLYLAMTFVAAALAGGLIVSFGLVSPGPWLEAIYYLSRSVMYQITSIYAVRMAGVFMISLGTLWVRTGAMPRWLALITYLVAILLLLSISLNPWFTLLFPIWVFVISLLILVRNYRRLDEAESSAAA
jgi:hypothetical protein